MKFQKYILYTHVALLAQPARMIILISNTLRTTSFTSRFNKDECLKATTSKRRRLEREDDLII
jgi:hypothetical protein